MKRILILLAAALLFLPLFAGAAQTDHPGVSLLTEAKRALLQQGDISAALQKSDAAAMLLEADVAKDPSLSTPLAQAHYFSAEMSMYKGAGESEIISRLKKAIIANPTAMPSIDLTNPTMSDYYQRARKDVGQEEGQKQLEIGKALLGAKQYCAAADPLTKASSLLADPSVAKALLAQANNNCTTVAVSGGGSSASASSSSSSTPSAATSTIPLPPTAGTKRVAIIDMSFDNRFDGRKAEFTNTDLMPVFRSALGGMEVEAVNLDYAYLKREFGVSEPSDFVVTPGILKTNFKNGVDAMLESQSHGINRLPYWTARGLSQIMTQGKYEYLIVAEAGAKTIPMKEYNFRINVFKYDDMKQPIFNKQWSGLTSAKKIKDCYSKAAADIRMELAK